MNYAELIRITKQNILFKKFPNLSSELLCFMRLVNCSIGRQLMQSNKTKNEWETRVFQIPTNNIYWNSPRPVKSENYLSSFICHCKKFQFEWSGRWLKKESHILAKIVLRELSTHLIFVYHIDYM